MMKFQAVFFDAGNTLVHINMPFISRVLDQFGQRRTPEELWRIEYRLRVQFDREDLIKTTTDSGRFSMYFSSILKECGLTDDPALTPVLGQLKEYMDRYNLWDYTDPQAIPLLGRLRQQGYRIGVITNAPGTAAKLFQRLGLTPHVDALVDSGCVGIEKPDPRIFNIAMEQLSVPPGGSLFIGDMYCIDVLGARAAGMTGILLDPAGLQPHRPCHRVRSLSDLETFLESPHAFGKIF